MGTPAEAAAWKMLTDELGRTAVISDDFKGTLFAIAGKIAEQARDCGREEGKRMARSPEVQATALTPSEERAMIGLDNSIDELSHMFANMLSGERVPSFAREARQLAAALLLRTRRGGMYLKNDVRHER
jgi:hypothetical protein